MRDYIGSEKFGVNTLRPVHMGVLINNSGTRVFNRLYTRYKHTQPRFSLLFLSGFPPEALSGVKLCQNSPKGSLNSCLVCFVQRNREISAF